MLFIVTIYILLIIFPVFTHSIQNQFNSFITEYLQIRPSLPPNSFEKSTFEKRDKQQKGWEKCMNIVKEDNSCIQSILEDPINEQTLKGFCSLFNSDKCQKSIKKGFSSYPECQEESIKTIVQDYSDILNLISFYYTFFCGEDENSKSCPYMEYIMEENISSGSNASNSIEMKEKKFYEYMKNNCNSKKCTDIFITFFEGKNDIYKKVKEMAKKVDNPKNNTSKEKRSFSLQNFKENGSFGNALLINKTISFMKSEECINMHKTISKDIDDSTENYGENKYNSNTIILLIISLLLLTLI
ncbi:hypothetical protein PIROE2DRAFT_3494 [Piromyces sp. E2]|nr:hypothetical protein PIROE2DRAFT_3494 [Piromyces sp. E2]|eukprot:OUM68795.1 hypothetical protein PIROE2DRAFT_3494 [Piromyces sp. E2]